MTETNEDGSSRVDSSDLAESELEVRSRALDGHLQKDVYQ
jgi:hypothetical protein